MALYHNKLKMYKDLIRKQKSEISMFKLRQKKLKLLNYNYTKALDDRENALNIREKTIAMMQSASFTIRFVDMNRLNKLSKEVHDQQLALSAREKDLFMREQNSLSYQDVGESDT